MRTPSAAELLDVWEGSLGESPTRRALGLLASACPELSHQELAVLPIGQRDARLLELRERLFGPRISLVVACPQCGEHLESQVRVSDIAWLPPQHPDSGTHAVESHGYHVTFRLPNSDDLITLPPGTDAARAREFLLGRCVLDVRQPKQKQTPDPELPDDVLADVTAEMATADPGANVELAFECPTCAHHWRDVLDIAGFLWREIHAWAQRTLRDVHVLASAYGWREPDVLAMSPTRRMIYLELCRQ